KAPLARSDVDHLNALRSILFDREIDAVLRLHRVPHTAVLARLCILHDEVSKELVAAIGQNAALRIEDPFEIAAELIDVVDVALEAQRLQAGDGAYREPLVVDTSAMLRAKRSDHHGSENGEDGRCSLQMNARNEKRQRRKVETLIAHVPY